VLFVACWRGLFRMLLGREGWDKTARVQEQPASTLVTSGVGS